MIKLSDREAFPCDSGVYILHFPNGKKYVGMTSRSLRVRVSHHCNAVIRGRLDTPVRFALAKYGVDAVFVSFPAVDCPLHEMEQREIRHFRAAGVKLYNMTDGGEGARGFQHSDATRAAMSNSAKRTWTQERRNKAGAVLRQPGTRERLVASQKKSWTTERRKAMGNHIRARSAKLTEDAVASIAAMLADGMSCAGIARQYGVTPEAISAIKHGKNWAHITGIKRAA